MSNFYVILSLGPCIYKWCVLVGAVGTCHAMSCRLDYSVSVYFVSEEQPVVEAFVGALFFFLSFSGAVILFE